MIVPSVFASSDNASAPWFSVAGLNRGGIDVAKQVLDRTTQSERDTLSSGRVNAIAAFPGQGISIWDQKTLQIEQTDLSRISVRRLLIDAKKYVNRVGKRLVFEKNVDATRNAFINQVTPYFQNV